jgi:hypothetical protein
VVVTPGRVRVSAGVAICMLPAGGASTRPASPGVRVPVVRVLSYRLTAVSLDPNPLPTWVRLSKPAAGALLGPLTGSAAAVASAGGVEEVLEIVASLLLDPNVEAG